MKNKHQTAILYPIENDPQSIILYEELYKLGESPLMIPFLMKSDNKKIEISFGKDDLYFGDDLSNIKAIYVRGISTNTPLSMPPYINEYEQKVWQAKFLKENIHISIINSILEVLKLKGALIINELSAYLHHNTKVNFNLYLKYNGINIPDTYGTNDIQYLKKMYLKNKNLILKSPSGVGATRRVNLEMLDRNEISLKMTPALFQNEIKSSTVRIHTVGNKVILALEIISNDIDSRSDTEGFKVIQLTKKQENQIIKANKLLGWNFSAWDALIDENGKIFLVDGNPGPYIYWIGDYLTRVVMSKLAQFMVAFSESNSITLANKSITKSQIIHNNIFKIDKNLLHFVEKPINSWKKDLGLRY